MEAGIIGLPYIGKTTLFNALVAGHSPGQGQQSGGVKANVGVVPVPDPRLITLNKFIPTDKIVPASLKLVDVPGLARGASAGAGAGNKFLSAVRNVDAMVHVVRCFEDPGVPHVEGSVNPARDVDTLDTELMLADLEQIEGMVAKAERSARSGDKEAKLRVEILEASQSALNDSKPIRTILNKAPLNTPDAKKELKALALLTAKPMLYVANVGDSDAANPAPGQGPLVQKLRDAVATLSGGSGVVVPVCAKLEAEIAELPESERAEMLSAMGLSEPALAVLARAILNLLGLHYFFTAGQKEIKAWTIPIGATGPQAAGAIHSDFERGFIRVEVYSVDDLAQYKTEQAIKAAGKMRTEGKNYVMHDSDVCHFLFNV